MSGNSDGERYRQWLAAQQYAAGQAQTAAPNQIPQVTNAYNPEYPLGVQRQQSGDNNKTVPGDSYTVHTYDSKPPAYETVFITDFKDTFQYSVPAGKVFFLKEISVYNGIWGGVRLDPRLPFPYNTTVMTITVDNYAVNLHGGDSIIGSTDSNTTKVYLPHACLCRTILDVFIPILGGSTLSLQTTYTSSAVTYETIAAFTYSITGDLINATGRSTTQEFGNYGPIPITKGTPIK